MVNMISRKIFTRCNFCLILLCVSLSGFLVGCSDNKHRSSLTTRPAEIRSSDFLLGVVFFSDANPVNPGDTSSSLYHNVAISLRGTVDVANQHILNFGGNAGADTPDPGFSSCPASGCDSFWRTLDWSGIDSRIKLMEDMHVPIKMITLYGAPNFMTQVGNEPDTPNRKPGWDCPGGGYCDFAQVDPKYNEMWADLCHFVVKRYLPKGVRYYQVWNEMKGYYGKPHTPIVNGLKYNGWDFPGYTNMYNAVWDRIKGDPATADAQLGGPYAIMVNYQADGTTPGARGKKWSEKGDTGKIVLRGPWGGIRSEVTSGLIYWRDHAKGWDFICVDGGPEDDDGNHGDGGNPNPNNWSNDFTRSYWHDVGKWLHDSIARGKPVVVSEVYPDSTGEDWVKSLDVMRQPDPKYGQGCKNAQTGESEPCINLTLEWNDQEPNLTFYSLTDSATGQLTPLGRTYLEYRKAHHTFNHP